jgi:Leucine rich repeat
MASSELRLRVQHGREVLEVCLPLGATVGALRIELAGITKQLARNLRLIHKGKVLAVDGAALTALGVAANDKLMLLSSGGVPSAAPAVKRPAPDSQPAVDAASLRAREGAWRATGTVSLRDAGLDALPPAVCALGEALRVLDVSGNASLSALPALDVHKRLTRLSADGCGLKDVPWLSLPVSLTILSLAGNGLTSLSPALGALGSLKKLSVARNRLAVLPVEIGSLSALTSLDVSGNQLTELPAELGCCIALEELSVSKNNLSSLPAQLGLCGRLCILNAANNVPLRAAGIPPALLRAPSLHTLLLQGCEVTLLQLRELDGYAELERRRQARAGQALSSVGAAHARENADAEMRRRAG